LSQTKKLRKSYFYTKNYLNYHLFYTKKSPKKENFIFLLLYIPPKKTKKSLILLQIDYFSTKPSIFVQIFSAKAILAKSIFERKTLLETYLF